MKINRKKILMVGPIEKTGGGVSNHTSILIKEYQKMGLHVTVLNESPGRNYSLYVNNLLKALRRTVVLFFYLVFFHNNYDIIHIQSSGPIGGFLPALTSCLAKKFVKIKLVITFHHGESERFIKRHRSLFEFVVANTDRLILVSNEQKLLIKKYFDRDYSEKLVVIPNGFDLQLTEKILNSNVMTRKGNIISIVNLSRLFPVKGQQYLIQALSQLSKTHEIRDFQCNIIGSGPLYDNLSALIKKYDLEKNIVLDGWLPKDKIDERLLGADFFVLPSLNEASPLVLFEALGYGLPIIASRVGGIPDIINSDEYGFLVKPGDPVELADAIKRASNKKWDKEKILFYSKQYDWKNIAKITYDSYPL
jgi:teichuronic acid biosynthesis glycosyltransferase TuaC